VTGRVSPLFNVNEGIHWGSGGRVTTKKRESYRIAFTEDLRRLVVDLNAVLSRLEDRLDQIEGFRVKGS